MLSKNITPDFYIKSIDSVQYQILREKKEKYLPGISQHSIRR